MWFQKTISLLPRSRGFHIITREVLEHIPEISSVQIGILQLFLQHTSASLSINENVDPDVRVDFESYFNTVIPDNAKYFIHTSEGSDDMPAHIKSSVLGVSLSIPITKGRLNIGTWQGIYLCEHRDYGGARNLVLTIHGE